MDLLVVLEDDKALGRMRHEDLSLLGSRDMLGDDHVLRDLLLVHDAVVAHNLRMVDVLHEIELVRRRLEYQLVAIQLSRLYALDLIALKRLILLR